MIDKNYFNTLSEYVGKNILWKFKENKIIVRCDIQSFYTIEKIGTSNFLLYYNERGRETLMEEYSSEIELKRGFALQAKNHFENCFNYVHFSDFDNEKLDINSLKNKIELYCNSDYYSVDNSRKGRVNLESEENGKYSIYYLKWNGEKIYLEKKQDVPFVFCRFYAEITYMEKKIDLIKEYSEFFNDFISDKIILEKLIY